MAIPAVFIKKPRNYNNLDDPVEARRLVKDLLIIISQLNATYEIKSLPMPTNLAAAVANGLVILSWDDLADTYRSSRDGAKIWRADSSVDANTSFDSNSNKSVIVPFINSTSWTDANVAAGTYIYWVQWIAMDGALSNVAGGVSATIS